MKPRNVLSKLLFGSAVLLCFGTAPPAAQSSPPAASEVGLSYSTDGVNYSSSPPQLFSNMPRFVPGDEVSTRLWIRNARADAVDISMQPSRPDASDLLLTPSHSGMTRLEAGASTAITIRASLPLTASNRTQNQTTDNLRLRVNAQVAVPEASTPQPPHVPQSELGETGFSGGIFPLILGMLGVGSVLYAMSKRPTRQEHTMEGGRP
jgi:hypothetical protein